MQQQIKSLRQFIAAHKALAWHIRMQDAAVAMYLGGAAAVLHVSVPVQ
jgi:hypothetical protein